MMQESSVLTLSPDPLLPCGHGVGSDHFHMHIHFPISINNQALGLCLDTGWVTSSSLLGSFDSSVSSSVPW